MIQKGDLKRISFPRLLRWIIAKQKNGTVKVTRGTEARVFLVNDGKLLAAFSDSPSEKLWMILFKKGVLDEHQLLSLRERQHESGKQLEVLLEELEFLSIQEIGEAGEMQATEI